MRSARSRQTSGGAATAEIRRVDLRLRVGRFASRDLALVVGGKVDAADNADFPVDDHDLPVVAVVGRVAARRGLQGIGRVELQHVDAGSPQAVEKLDRRVARSIGIVDDVDGDTGRALGDQHIAQPFAAKDNVLQRVIFKIDVVPCSPNCLEDRGKGAFAVPQQARRIAGRQRRSRHRLLNRVMTVQQLVLPRPTRDAGQQRLALTGGQRAIRPDDSGLARRRDVRVGDALIDIRHAAQPATARSKAVSAPRIVTGALDRTWGAYLARLGSGPDSP